MWTAPRHRYKRIAIDTSKAVFTVHGIDQTDRTVLRRNFSRPAFEAFIAKLAPTPMALEACGGSHHWGRWLTQHGHQVRLIRPQYVKPFVKRNKNDRNDAEAISEAAGRPGMSTVPIKSAERQAAAMILGVRELLVSQRTQVINAMRGHAAEFGVLAAKGPANVTVLMKRVAEDAAMPAAAYAMLTVLNKQMEHLDAEIADLDTQLRETAKLDETAQRLMAVPGVGPVGAITLSLTVDAAQFEDGRHFASWLGLVPKEMMIGRTDEWMMPGCPRAIKADPLFGSHSRNPSGPAAMRRTEKAAHMTASEPTSSNAETLDPKGPSTHVHPVHRTPLRTADTRDCNIENEHENHLACNLEILKLKARTLNLPK